MSANPYLEKLHALKAKKGHLSSPPKLTKPTEVPEREGFVGFVSDRSSPFSDFGGAFGRTLAALESRNPDFVPPARWQQAIDDGRAFMAKWGKQAEALGWTARDLFGLHQPPAKPHPSYSRLSRYDDTGLVWLLQGRSVLVLTDATAAIENATGAITIYRRFNKPALGPGGDNLSPWQFGGPVDSGRDK
jgi:hypothetical protein